MHVNASLDDIVTYLDGLLEVAKYQDEPGANGLLYRAGGGVSKFAVAVNTSMTTIVGAVKTGAQLLVVHHPSWPDNDLHLYDEKMAAIEAGGLSLYGAHVATSDLSPRQSRADLEHLAADVDQLLAGQAPPWTLTRFEWIPTRRYAFADGTVILAPVL